MRRISAEGIHSALNAGNLCATKAAEKNYKKLPAQRHVLAWYAALEWCSR